MGSWMQMPRYLLFAAALLAATLLVAACGGDDDPKAGKGTRITDPALVPTSSPISPQIVYKISGDVVVPTGGTPSKVGNGTATASAGSNYTVQPGDTCGAIATKYGITTDLLLKTNRTINADCTNLKGGDILKIPAVGTASGTPSGPTPRPSGREHIVNPGDTCDGIARNFGVDVNRLIAINGLNSDCTNLRAGQTIKIP